MAVPDRKPRNAHARHHHRSSVPAADLRADGDPACGAALPHPRAADQFRLRHGRGGVPEPVQPRRDAGAAGHAGHLVAVPVRRAGDRDRGPGARQVAAARPPAGAFVHARRHHLRGDALLRVLLAGGRAARAGAADAVHRLHPGHAVAAGAEGGGTLLGHDQGGRRRADGAAGAVRRAAVGVGRAAGDVLGRAAGDDRRAAAAVHAARQGGRAVRAGFGVLAARDGRADRVVPDLPARRVLPGRRVPGRFHRTPAAPAHAAAGVGPEPARDPDVRVVLRAVLLLLQGHERAVGRADDGGAEARPDAERGAAAVSHRRRVAAAARDPRRKRPRQPARGHRAGADLDLHAGAGDDHARAFGISDTLYGALLVYAAVSTILPSLVLAKPVDFDVQVGPIDNAPSGAAMPATPEPAPQETR